MKRSKKLQDELDQLRNISDDEIDYSEIPAIEDSWFETAELAFSRNGRVRKST